MVAIADGVAQVRLNRPEYFNTFDLNLARKLVAAVEAVLLDDTVRVIVVLGSGRAFCAGGDLKQVAGAERRDVMLGEIARTVQRAIEGLANGSKPVLMVVHGSTAGGGLGLLGAADLVFAAQSAVFVSAYTAVGLTPDCGTTWFLPQLVGFRRAMELVLTNRRLSAVEALEWGLVTSVHPDDEVLETALSQARRLAREQAPALGTTRQLMRASATRSLAEQMAHEAETIAAAAVSPEATRLVDAFVRGKP